MIPLIVPGSGRLMLPNYTRTTRFFVLSPYDAVHKRKKKKISLA